ncbi:Suppressor of Sensor Kinase (SLN1) [Coemansia sp. RSA 2559]|nr:Suppressor of Sensor Kinase (SLN1) [Coemansia sp. RSA 2559]
MEGGKMSLAGTPMYMAPEVIAGSNGGATGSVGGGGGGAAARHEFRPGKFGAQDIWSLGCCVVEMVTGHPPWAHLDNEWAIMYHVVSGDPPLPGVSEVSSGCMRFLKRCLNRQPADRPGAAELLQDEWLADTLKSLERAAPQNQQQPSRLASEPADYVPNLGFLSSSTADQTQTDDMLYAHRANNPMDPMLGMNSRDDAHMHSYSSVGSAGSTSNPANRSRAPSINRKNISGDLRFMPLGADATNPEAMFSLIDHRSIGGSLSSGDRSPGSAGAGLHGTLAGFRIPMSSIGMSPLARTPGSPGSTHSLHAAWPYNKDAVAGLGSTSTSSHGNNIGISALTSTQKAAPPLVPSTSAGLMPWHALSTSGIGADSATAAAAVPNDSLLSAGLELAAIYSTPSAIYQAINGASGSSSSNAVLPSKLQNAMIMDSPVDSVATPSELHQFSAESADASRPISSPGGNADVYSNNMSAQESFPSGTVGTDVSASALSSDEIQDLSETTRSVVTAMLSMPLEGVDVAGVAGWLGEGNTPMELLDAKEIKETVETTSHIVARQREQQIRRQQVIRSQLNRQKSQDEPTKNKEASGSEYRSNSGMSDSQTIGKGVVVEQRIEPPAVFPLPPDDTEDEEYEYEEEAEDEYEEGADYESDVE